MLIARNKEKENIVEFLLYMWQVEDIIRAYHFDINLIQIGLIDKHDVPQEVKYEMREWYQRIIDEMLKEGSSERGHIGRVKFVMSEIQHLHLQLLTVWQDKKYMASYEKASPYIQDLYRKSAGLVVQETEVCLNALYGLLLLKLKKTTISRETTDALKTISEMLAYLAANYKLYRSGKLDISKEKSN
ncbi:MAG: DUF4924 family protein [Bacteroidetes bacterium]|nr:DUF4924 family protein [Bacteroidota bacterium]MBV6461182.1 hypothetical protein [Flavobacteriales bacterium]MCC7050856.1 DUF4924 family protein [Bacteroidia bacterium]WKZ75411.1 MAG: DUF4924 family protein [Vicingaceae bacterium]MCL4817256.1 DUF4924 family protein [Flavobacteriales bacterium]